jgi:hypothetical protein
VRTRCDGCSWLVVSAAAGCGLAAGGDLGWCVLRGNERAGQVRRLALPPTGAVIATGRIAVQIGMPPGQHSSCMCSGLVCCNFGQLWAAVWWRLDHPLQCVHVWIAVFGFHVDCNILMYTRSTVCLLDTRIHWLDCCARPCPAARLNGTSVSRSKGSVHDGD